MAQVNDFTPSLASQILAKACCKKFIHSMLANLGMKLLDTGFIILLSLLGLASKTSCNLLLGLLFPLRNLIWMHAILLASSDKVCSPGSTSRTTWVLNSAVNFLLDLDIKSLRCLLTPTLAHGPVFQTHFSSIVRPRKQAKLSLLLCSRCLYVFQRCSEPSQTTVWLPSNRPQPAPV